MIESLVMKFLLGYIESHPELAIFVVIGFLQVTVRPLCDLIELMIKASPTTRDDQFLVELREKAWFKGLAYVMKLILGIKIPSVKEAEAPAPPSAL